MSVLICKNAENEGPGTIEDYLMEKGLPYKIVELSQGESIPDHDDFEALVIMGGPMSVNDNELYPYLEEEKTLVKDFISRDKRILGICLGAQIMAKALGSRVYRGTEEEIGWYDIELTEEGAKDLCMKSLAIHPEGGDISNKFKVFHWHGETFTMPTSAIRLASSERYPNQAFRYGENAYAFQFHIEVSKEIIYDWFDETPFYSDKLREETEQFYDAYQNRATQFYEKYFK